MPLRWSAFAAARPELAAFGVERLRAAPASLGRSVLFELLVAEARCNGYGDVSLPATTRRRSADAADPG